MRAEIALLLLLPSAAFAARSDGDPLSLQITRTHLESRVSLGWRLRWDGMELFDTPRTIATGLGEAFVAPEDSLRNLLWNTRFDFYGVRLKPFRRAEPPPPPVVRSAETPSGEAGGGEAPAEAAATAASPRSRLNLEPDWEGLRLQGRRDFNRWVLSSVFDQVLPQARAAPRWQKEAAFGGLVEGARSWDADPFEYLPGTYPVGLPGQPQPVQP